MMPAEPTPVRLARIEEKIDALNGRVERMEQKIDTAYEAVVASRGAVSLTKELLRILPIAAIVSAAVSVILDILAR
jgi:hypothetical protein